MSQTIVDVQITREIPVVTQIGFGSLLFVGEKATVNSEERVRSYGNLAEVLDDFADSSPVYTAAVRYFGQQLRPESFIVGLKADAESYTTALTAIRDQNDDWYAVAIQSASDANIEAVSDYIQALPRLFLAASASGGIIDSLVDNDIASTLLAKGNWRTALIYSSQAAEFPQVAWAGGMLPRDPGSATWAFKTLTGITPDLLNSGQRSAATGKRASVYINVAGNNVTLEGYTFEPGNYIDVVRGTDWLAQRMSERIFAQLVAQPKVPYINGDAVIEQEIRAQMDVAVQRSVIAPGYTITVPPASEQDPNDRGNRRYRNITFRATLAGAVHGVEIRGVVTV